MPRPVPPSRLSTRRADLASFDHAYAVACQRRAAGEPSLLIIATGNPIQPFRVATGSPVNDEHVLACVA